MAAISNLFDTLASLKVGVIGDLMLDTYMWGTVERISPEAPVPVVTLQHKEYRIGGAGNVALNGRSLGAAVSLFSVTGNDEHAQRLRALLQEKQIEISGIIQSEDRPTTCKTRIISRNQQMLRLDEETTRDLEKNDEERLWQQIEEYVEKEKPDVIILEDYNKGVLTESLISSVMGLCKKAGVITAVDPKRKHFFSYRQADIFKPNLKEIKEALNLLADPESAESFAHIHTELHQLLQHRISLVTLSERGVFVQEGKEGRLLPSHVRNVADVSGAGDTVIAVAAMVYAATRDRLLMAEIANIAGGLVCEEVGTVPINKERLQQECGQLLAENK